jgi:hypothetical protein
LETKKEQAERWREIEGGGWGLGPKETQISWVQ